MLGLCLFNSKQPIGECGAEAYDIADNQTKTNNNQGNEEREGKLYSRHWIISEHRRCMH